MCEIVGLASEVTDEFDDAIDDVDRDHEGDIPCLVIGANEDRSGRPVARPEHGAPADRPTAVE